MAAIHREVTVEGDDGGFAIQFRHTYEARIRQGHGRRDIALHQRANGTVLGAQIFFWARLVYALLTKGTDYVERSEDHYEQQHRDRTVRYLQRKAAAFGLRLEPAHAV